MSGQLMGSGVGERRDSHHSSGIGSVPIRSPSITPRKIVVNKPSEEFEIPEVPLSVEIARVLNQSNY